MKIRTFKTTFLFAFLLVLSGALSAQIVQDTDLEAQKFAIEILKEEGLPYKGYDIKTQINDALSVLDERKDKKLIDETTYQQGLHILISSQTAMEQRAIDQRLAGNGQESPRKPFIQSKTPGSKIYALAKKRLDQKLVDGIITQSEHEEKMAKLNKRYGKAVK